MKPLELDRDTVFLALEVMGDGERSYKTMMDELAAEHEVDRVYSKQYLEAKGTIAEREAQATISDEYDVAMRKLIKAKAERKRWETEKAKAEKIPDLYQTERADIRAIERVTR